MTKSILNLEGVQVLSRNEQKNVNGGKLPGGSGGGTCAAYWPDSTQQTLNSATYYADNISVNNNTWVFSGMSSADAQAVASAKPGGRWCCSSCSSASWL